MQSQKIILLPPTHEQSLPSFHLREDLLTGFLAYLEEHGFNVVEEPEPLGNLGPDSAPLIEVKIEANTPVDKLEAAMEDFLRGQSA
jgi:hypothetical protein